MIFEFAVRFDSGGLNFLEVGRVKIGNVVCVDWEDSYGCSSKWETLDKGDMPQTMFCRSIGWVTNKSKKCLVIVPHMAINKILEVNQGCGDMAIPVRAIVRIKRIKV
jgi:hypothetical protein